MKKNEFIGEDGKTYVTKEKKPIYKRPGFIIGIIVLSLLVYWLSQPTDIAPTATEPAANVSETQTIAAKTEAPKTESPKTEAPRTEKPKTEAPKTEAPRTEAPKMEAAVTATREQRAALDSANNYLAFMSFPDEGLRNQLEYEGFPADAIDYALENIVVNWNQQAVKKAEEYLNFSSGMSDQSLYNQLIYEGFTEEQAQYGIDNMSE